MRPTTDGPAVVRLDGARVPPRELVGGKAHGVAWMRAQGVAVPPAFVVTTAACRRYFADPGSLDEIWAEVRGAMAWLESVTGRRFGHAADPLLVSVRSGAARSMPGMLDTVLDLGWTPETEESLAAAGGSEFAADTARRFREMYARVVLEDGTSAVPEEPWDQLREAVAAVFRSWQSARATAYRQHHGLSDDAGTAVTVQAMVFGNRDDRSGSGVLFTRNPLTGDPEPFGEWLPRAQGEDVVSGRFDGLPLADLAARLPEVHADLLATGRLLERAAGDVQDVEFTVESGRLWVLQTRSAKRSPEAAVRLAVRLVDDGVTTVERAIDLVSPEQLAAVTRPGLPEASRAAAELLASGVPACPGVASGRVVTDADAAVDAEGAGEEVVLVRPTTSPDDVHGMIAAVAVVTEQGGPTSHAAVVSRELGRPCVVGCGAGLAERLRDRVVTVDGAAGEVRAGRLELVAWSAESMPELARLADWLSAAGR